MNWQSCCEGSTIQLRHFSRWQDIAGKYARDILWNEQWYREPCSIIVIDTWIRFVPISAHKQSCGRVLVACCVLGVTDLLYFFLSRSYLLATLDQYSVDAKKKRWYRACSTMRLWGPLSPISTRDRLKVQVSHCFRHASDGPMHPWRRCSCGICGISNTTFCLKFILSRFKVPSDVSHEGLICGPEDVGKSWVSDWSVTSPGVELSNVQSSDDMEKEHAWTWMSIQHSTAVYRVSWASPRLIVLLDQLCKLERRTKFEQQRADRGRVLLQIMYCVLRPPGAVSPPPYEER